MRCFVTIYNDNVAFGFLRYENALRADCAEGILLLYVQLEIVAVGENVDGGDGVLEAVDDGLADGIL